MQREIKDVFYLSYVFTIDTRMTDPEIVLRDTIVLQGTTDRQRSREIRNLKRDFKKQFPYKKIEIKTYTIEQMNLFKIDAGEK